MPSLVGPRGVAVGGGCVAVGITVGVGGAFVARGVGTAVDVEVGVGSGCVAVGITVGVGGAFVARGVGTAVDVEVGGAVGTGFAIGVCVCVGRGSGSLPPQAVIIRSIGKSKVSSLLSRWFLLNIDDGSIGSLILSLSSKLKLVLFMTD
jgi:hypothetical protein